MDLFSDVPGKEEEERDLAPAEKRIKVAEEEEEEMVPDLTHVSQLLEECIVAHRFGRMEEAEEFMSKAKGLIAGLKSLPPLLAETPNSKRELILARDIHEYATVMAECADAPGEFDTEFAQLKPYYSAECESRIGVSLKKDVLFGGYLMILLEKNKMDEYHAELKSLPATALSGPMMEYVIRTEKLLSGELKLECQTLSETAREEIYGPRKKPFDTQEEEPQPKWELHGGSLMLVLRPSRSNAHPHFA